MPKIAFYAPMKPPTHSIPSGDRAIACGLLTALGANTALVSDLRIYDGTGDITLQSELINQADTEAQRLIQQGRAEDWKLWFTYHNYYKAPDLIGPKVSKALNIPYVLLEATRAKKRLDGPWAKFAKYAEDACDHADAIFYFTKQDRQALETYCYGNQQIIHLSPFLATTKTTNPRIKPANNVLLSVGMLRKGAKSKSYALIARTLSTIKTRNWHLNIIGDGAARGDIETLFTQFGDRVTFLGQLDKALIADHYTQSSALFWPGVDEAFGMVYLEAQAAGLPVVAQDRPGLRDIIAASTHLSFAGDITGMADEIDQLLNNTKHWQNCSRTGIKHIKQNHLLKTAKETLMRTFTPLIGSSI